MSYAIVIGAGSELHLPAAGGSGTIDGGYAGSRAEGRDGQVRAWVRDHKHTVVVSVSSDLIEVFAKLHYRPNLSRAYMRCGTL